MSTETVPAAITSARTADRTAVRAEKLEVVLPSGDGIGPWTAAVARGEQVLVLGPSGAGKSTLLRALAGAIPEHIRATVTGTLRVAGDNPVSAGVARTADAVGFVAQDPSSGVCLPLVADEVALPLENRAWEPHRIGDRVTSVLAQVGALPLLERTTGTLSGGQLQRIALATALVAEPEVLLLDEPTAMLDGEGVAAVREAIRTVPEQVTTVLVEHRLDEWAGRRGTAGLPGRTVALDRSGRILADGPTPELLAEHGAALLAQGCWLPVDLELAAVLGIDDGLADPALPAALGRLLDASAVPEEPPAPASGAAPDAADRPVLQARGLAVRYGRTEVLHGVDLVLRAGELVAIIGTNGAGKSTLLAALAGLEPPAAGDVTGPPAGLIFQNPEDQFVGVTVRGELADGLPAASAPRVEEALAAVGLRDWADHTPFQLSGGQKRRLSIATMLLRDRPALLADEPGFGLDRTATGTTLGMLRAAADDGLAVAMTSHDSRAVAEHADHVVVLDRGTVSACVTPEELVRRDDLAAAAGMTVPPLLSRILELGLPLRATLRALTAAPIDIGEEER